MVVGVSGEDLRHPARDSRVALDEDGHLPTDGERGNIEQEILGLLRRVAAEDGGLDNSTKGNGLVGVDRLVRVHAIEEVTVELLDERNTGRAADEENFVYIHLVDLRVLEHLFYGLNSRTEEVMTQLLETGTGDGGLEVDAVEERVGFDGRLGGRGECSLRMFASRAETAESARVGAEM